MAARRAQSAVQLAAYAQLAAYDQLAAAAQQAARLAAEPAGRLADLLAAARQSPRPGLEAFKQIIQSLYL